MSSNVTLFRFQILLITDMRGSWRRAGRSGSVKQWSRVPWSDPSCSSCSRPTPWRSGRSIIALYPCRTMSCSRPTPWRSGRSITTLLLHPYRTVGHVLVLCPCLRSSVVLHPCRTVGHVFLRPGLLVGHIHGVDPRLLKRMFSSYSCSPVGNIFMRCPGYLKGMISFYSWSSGMSVFILRPGHLEGMFSSCALAFWNYWSYPMP
jgi:hypothetical protein